jgi:hypothetical protein
LIVLTGAVSLNASSELEERVRNRTNILTSTLQSWRQRDDERKARMKNEDTLNEVNNEDLNELVEKTDADVRKGRRASRSRASKFFEPASLLESAIQSYQEEDVDKEGVDSESTANATQSATDLASVASKQTDSILADAPADSALLASDADAATAALSEDGAATHSSSAHGARVKKRNAAKQLVLNSLQEMTNVELTIQELLCARDNVLAVEDSDPAPIPAIPEYVPVRSSSPRKNAAKAKPSSQLAASKPITVVKERERPLATDVARKNTAISELTTENMDLLANTIKGELSGQSFSDETIIAQVLNKFIQQLGNVNLVLKDHSLTSHVDELFKYLLAQIKIFFPTTQIQEEPSFEAFYHKWKNLIEREKNKRQAPIVHSRTNTHPEGVERGGVNPNSSDKVVRPSRDQLERSASDGDLFFDRARPSWGEYEVMHSRNQATSADTARQQSLPPLSTHSEGVAFRPEDRLFIPGRGHLENKKFIDRTPVTTAGNSRINNAQRASRNFANGTPITSGANVKSEALQQSLGRNGVVYDGGLQVRRGDVRMNEDVARNDSRVRQNQNTELEQVNEVDEEGNVLDAAMEEASGPSESNVEASAYSGEESNLELDPKKKRKLEGLEETQSEDFSSGEVSNTSFNVSPFSEPEYANVAFFG